MYLADSGPDFTLPMGRLTAKGGHPVRTGAGLADLGQRFTETKCPQPVSTEERDAIKAKLARALDYKGQRPVGIHWHEGHPDIKEYFDDIMSRIKGLYKRPRMLRCSAGARNRARIWTGQVSELLDRVKGPGGFTIVPTTFKMPMHRGPTYTIRSTSDPAIRSAMKRAVPGSKNPIFTEPLGKTSPAVVSHAPGSVVVGGAAYPTSRAAREAGATKATGELRVTTATGAAREALAADATLLPGLPSTIAGIPTNYLLYGGLALTAFMLLKK